MSNKKEKEKGKEIEVDTSDMPLDALILQCSKDRYKIAYAALRWAREVKQKENLPEPIQALLPRALREVLTKKVSLDEIEKLPMVIKISTGSQQGAAVPLPTIRMNTSFESSSGPGK